KLWAILTQLDAASWSTFAVGAVSTVGLLALRRWLPNLAPTLLVLVLAVAVSAVFDLKTHGIAVVGTLPAAYPKLAWPHVGGDDLVQMIAPAFGVMMLTTEALGVSRMLATTHGYTIDANRELIGMGASNALAGVSQGFVQAGGASQTM